MTLLMQRYQFKMKAIYTNYTVGRCPSILLEYLQQI